VLKTDQHGHFESPPLEPGLVQIKIEKEKYHTLIHKHNLEKAKVYDLSNKLRLVPDQVFSTLKGRILDQQQKVVQALLSIKGGKFKKELKVSGNFKLKVPPGDYMIRITAPQHISQEREMKIRGKGSYILNITLHPVLNP